MNRSAGQTNRVNRERDLFVPRYDSFPINPEKRHSFLIRGLSGKYEDTVHTRVKPSNNMILFLFLYLKEVEKLALPPNSSKVEGRIFSSQKRTDNLLVLSAFSRSEYLLPKSASPFKIKWSSPNY